MNSEKQTGETRSNADVPGARATPFSSSGATPLVLPVDQIQPYDHNPRRSANPEYDRIKDSIRTDGMNQPLVVTRRPGATDYMVGAGGNTRLQVLKELYDETDDPRYRDVHCLFRPWGRETDVLLAHLKENDLRGELSFIDKALAVFEVKRLMGEETGQEEVTQKQLLEVLRVNGYRLSQGLVSQMEYAVRTLLPLLPQALNNGLGRPQVERIRRLDAAAAALWRERRVDTPEEYAAVFETLCRRYDGPDWDFASLRRAIEAEIAVRVEVSIHAVSLQLEEGMAGRGSQPSRASETHAPMQAERKDTPAVLPTDNRERAAPEDDPAVPMGQASPAAIPGQSPARTGADATPELPVKAGVHAEPVAPTASAEPDPTSVSTLTIGTTGPTDLKSLRARAWTLASRLAQRNGLAELIRPLSATGLGFILRDVPDPALVQQLDEEHLAQVSMVWWQLAACSEITVAPLEQLLPHLEDGSVLQRALTEQDAGLLFDSVWTLDPGHTGYRLWRALNEQGWKDFLNLMDTYRTLHRQAEQTGVPLWGPAT